MEHLQLSDWYIEHELAQSKHTVSYKNLSVLQLVQKLPKFKHVLQLESQLRHWLLYKYLPSTQLKQFVDDPEQVLQFELQLKHW